MLSIIIPAYNEEKRILPTLKEYYSFFQNKLKNNFEIIVVVNNCNDNTLGIVEKFTKNKKVIKILNLSYYVGKGGAVIAGFKLAKGDLIGFVDADNSTNPKNFYKLFLNIHHNDGIIASRRINGAVVFPPRKLNQVIFSFLFNVFVRVLFQFKYKDTQCGAKLFKEETARSLIKKYSEEGWIFDVDLLYLCKKNNFKILEYPIYWTDKMGSKLIFFDGVLSLFRLIRYRFNF